MGQRIEQLSGLSVGELEALRLQQQEALSRPDGELVNALRGHREALAPLVIAASLQQSR